MTAHCCRLHSCVTLICYHKTNYLICGEHNYNIGSVPSALGALPNVIEKVGGMPAQGTERCADSPSDEQCAHWRRRHGWDYPKCHDLTFYKADSFPDFLLLSNGSLVTIQNMTWNGKQGFQEQFVEFVLFQISADLFEDPVVNSTFLTTLVWPRSYTISSISQYPAPPSRKSTQERCSAVLASSIALPAQPVKLLMSLATIPYHELQDRMNANIFSRQ